MKKIFIYPMSLDTMDLLNKKGYYFDQSFNIDKDFKKLKEATHIGVGLKKGKGLVDISFIGEIDNFYIKNSDLFEGDVLSCFNIYKTNANNAGRDVLLGDYLVVKSKNVEPCNLEGKPYTFI